MRNALGDVQVGLPTDRSQYIHRVGRTARAGKQVRPRRSGLDRTIAQPGLLWWQSRLLVGSLGLLRASARHVAAASGMGSCPPPLWGRGGAAVLTGTRRRAQGKGVLLLCDYESPSFMRQLRDVRVQTAPVVPQEAATAIQPHIARGLQVTPPTQLLGCRRRCALLDSMGDRCCLLVHHPSPPDAPLRSSLGSDEPVCALVAWEAAAPRYRFPPACRRSLQPQASTSGPGRRKGMHMLLPTRLACHPSAFWPFLPPGAPLEMAFQEGQGIRPRNFN